MSFILIKTGGLGYNSGGYYKEFQIDSASDLSDLPECAPGSKAYTADGGSTYRMNNSGNWVKSNGATGGSGGASFYNGLLEALRQDISADDELEQRRVVSLNNTVLARDSIVEAIDSPIYVSDSNIANYSEYNLSESGWYVFARIKSKDGTTVDSRTTVTGAAGYIVDADHVDVAVRFGVTAVSQPITINWGDTTETIVFKATDLAIRNLDYRTTFYVYDIADFTTWTYAVTTDAKIVANKDYYTKNGDTYTKAEVTVDDDIVVYYDQTVSYDLTTDETFVDGTVYYTKNGDTYTAATVTAGDPVPADTYYIQFNSYAVTNDMKFVSGKTYYTVSGTTVTPIEVAAGDPVLNYYNHTKVRFEGMARNVTYKCDTLIDCPMEFVLPVIEDETHGCWFEIRCQHAGEYSMTLIPPSSDIKIATEHTQKETAGINMINLHYTSINGTKIWRFMNTHSSIPT